MARDLVIEHGVVAYQWDDESPTPCTVLHFVGYPIFPDDAEMDRLLQDLATDPCFGLIGIPFAIKRATPEQVRFYMEDIPEDVLVIEDEDDFC